MEYTNQDFTALKREVGRKASLFGGLFALFAAGCLTFFFLRLQFICTVFTLVFGVAFVFFSYFFLLPPLRYRKFLKEMTNGRQKVSEGKFVAFEDAEEVRDGLLFRPLITEDEKGFQHKYCWDSQKPLIEIEPGAMVRVTTYGQSIKKLEII